MEGNKPFTKEQVASLPGNWFTPSGTGPNRKQRRSMHKPFSKSKYSNLVTRWQFERDKNGKAKWIPHFDQKVTSSTSPTELVTPSTLEVRG
jgi:hypothetical protein